MQHTNPTPHNTPVAQHAAYVVEGGALGINCRHLYEETALAQSEAKLAQGGTNAYAAKLKLKN
jgi:hypothetical protein